MSSEDTPRPPGDSAPAPTAPADRQFDRPPRLQTLRDLLPGALFGYDFFISYSRQDAPDYARALEQELGGQGYTCFLDRRDMPPGQGLRDTTLRALRRSRTLILVATPKALQSQYVYDEVILFGRRRPVIAVNLAATLENTDSQHPVRRRLGDVVWINEPGAAIPQRPSADVTRDIIRGFAFVRQRTRRLLLTVAGAAVLAALVLFGLYSTRSRMLQSAIAESRRIASQSGEELGKNLDAALLLGARALITHDTLEARTSLLEALSAQPSLVWISRGRGGIVERPLFLPDGRGLVLINSNNSISVVDLATRQESVEPGSEEAIRRNQSAAEPAGVTAAALSHDGRLLALGTRDNSILLWDLARHRQAGPRLEGHTAWVVGLDFDPQDRILASATYEGSIILWDVATGSPVPPQIQPASELIDREVLFGSDGRELLVAGRAPTRFGPGNKEQPARPEENAVALFDVASGRRKGPLLTECGVRHAQLQVRPGTSQLGCINDRGELVIVDWRTRRRVPLPGGEPPRTDYFSFTPDGREVAFYNWGEPAIEVRGIDSEQTEKYPLNDRFRRPGQLAFSPDGRLLAFTGNFALYLLDRAQRNPLAAPFASTRGYVTGVAAAGDGGTVAVGLSGATVLVYDGRTGQLVRPPPALPDTPPDKFVNAVALDPAGRWLAAGDAGGVLYVWSSKGMAQRCAFNLSESIRTIAFGPGPVPRLVAGTDEGTLAWVDVESCAKETSPDAHERNIMSLAFNPGGDTLVSGGADDDVRFWDPATRQPVGEVIKAGQQYVKSFAFSPDGKSLYSAGQDGSVAIWDPSQRQRLRKLPGHSLQVSSLAVSPSGDLLLSCSLDGSVALWDVRQEQMVGRPLRVNEPGVGVVFVRPDVALSAHLSGHLYTWDLKPARWIDKARSIAAQTEAAGAPRR